MGHRFWRIGTFVVIVLSLVGSGCKTTDSAEKEEQSSDQTSEASPSKWGPTAREAAAEIEEVEVSGPSKWSEQKPVNYEGGECNDAFISIEEYTGNPETGLGEEEGSPRQQVLAAVCFQPFLHYPARGTHTLTNPRAPKIEALRIGKRHEKFDDRAFDHLEASLFLVFSHYGFPHGSETRDDEKPGMRYPVRIQGLGYAYATRVETQAIRDRLGEMDLSEEARESYLELFEEAKSYADSYMKKLDEGARIIAYEVPAEVVQRRAKNYETYAGVYERLDELSGEVEDALSDEKKTLAVAEKLVELRGSFLSQCETDRCLLTPEHQRISEQFTRLYLGMRDAPGVRAERMLYTSPGGSGEDSEESKAFNTIPLANDIYRAKLEEGRPMRRKYEDYESAREEGADEKAALAMVGGGPVLTYKLRRFLVRDIELAMPELAEEITGDKILVPMEQKVKKIEDEGDHARLVFSQKSWETTKTYDCRETDRVARITFSGEVIYEKKCKTKKVTETGTAAPIEIPTYELGDIQAGDEVHYLKLNNVQKGHVVRVYRDGNLVQIRGTPVE